MSLQGLQQRTLRPLSGSRLRVFFDLVRGRGLAEDDHWLIREFGGPLLRLAAVALVLSFFLPVHGLTPSICIFHNLTGYPCPSCGLTRSVTAISHLEFATAFHYNPFGFVIYPALVMGALLSLLPAGPRRRLASRFDPVRPVVRPFFTGMLLAMMAYGFWRIGMGIQL